MDNTKKQFLVTEYGVVSDCEVIQTANIQKCIDVCRDAGGGEIIIPAGTFIVGSLRLYSNMTLRLQSGAILTGSKSFKDYTDFKVPTTIQYLYDEHYINIWNLPPYYFYALITAFDAENINIIGEPGSVINGSDTFDANGEEKFRGPMGMIISGVKNLHLEGYTFENSANWSHTLDGCENITIENVTIKAGHDGFNLHHSTNIKVRDCRLETGDDCFAGYDIENLVVENCYLNTACNGMRIGGYNLKFENCIFNGPGRYPHLSEDTFYTHAIFKYYAVRPDSMRRDAEKIMFVNCMISDADKLFFYDNGRLDISQQNVPLREFILENANVSNIRHTSLFKGNGEKGKLVMRNVRIDFDSDEPFLEIDSSIDLIMENVEFLKEVTIITGSGSKLSCKGQTTVKLEHK